MSVERENINETVSDAGGRLSRKTAFRDDAQNAPLPLRSLLEAEPILTLWVPITPKPKGRGRIFMNRVFTPKATRVYEKQVSSYMKLKYRDLPLDGPLDVRMAFYLARPKSVSEKKRPHPNVKPDLDNFQKSFLDAANGILFEDDCQVVISYSEKRYSKTQGTWLEIRKLGCAA